MVNPALVIALRRKKKVRRGPEVATFRTKTLNFTWIIHLNWLSIIELRGPGASWSLLLLVITVVRMYNLTTKLSDLDTLQAGK